MVLNQSCSNCGEGIANPFCEKCYSRELMSWLRDYGLSPSLINYVYKALQDEKAIFPTDYHCILCEKEPITLCTYCYFLKVERILRRTNLSPVLIQRVMRILNYGLYNKHFSSLNHPM